MAKKLGVGQYQWTEDEKEVDLSLPEPLPRSIRIQTEGKSVKLNLNTTALMVIDMQKDYCAKGGVFDLKLGLDWAKNQAPIAPLKKLIPFCRHHGIRIIWVTCGIRSDLANMPPNQCTLVFPPIGGPGGEIVPELKVEQRPEDISVYKCRLSGFWDTPLDTILRNLGIRTILFSGVNTDQCVHHTLADANFLGYGCIMLKDCVATVSPDYCAESTFYNVKVCFGFLSQSEWIIEGIEKAEK